VDSGGPKEVCISWGASCRHLANAIEPSVCGGDAAFLSNYFDHLLHVARQRLAWGRGAQLTGKGFGEGASPYLEKMDVSAKMACFSEL